MELHSFALEHLEERALFSVVAPIDTAPVTATTPVLATPHITAASKSPFAGVFNVAGTFTQPFGNPDAGAQYKFTGLGKTASLGKFTLSGRAQGPGFVANGRYSGRFVLTNSQGTITLSAHGPTQTPGPLPASFSFLIFKGTGAYAHSSGKGKIIVSASTTTHKFVFQFRPAK